MGHQFWLRLRNMHVVMRAASWVRLINHRVMSEFLFHPFEKYGARAYGWFQGPPKAAPSSTDIRPYRDTDLPDCLRLANELSRSAEFGLVWDERTLGRQLSHKGFPRTLVAEHNGRVAGFVNYFLQEYLGRREMLAGVIDLLSVNELPFDKQKRLLRAALSQIASDGCHTTLFLASPGIQSTCSRGWDLSPKPPHYDYVIQSMAPDVPVVKTRRLHGALARVPRRQ